MPLNEIIDKLLTFLWVFSISAFAGITRRVRRLQGASGNDELKKEGSWILFAADIVISGFIGMLTYYICVYANVPDSLMAVYIGVSAHMGTKALSLYEALFSKGMKG
ncbi:phage holin family protein [Campylobacter sp. 19-13652]|uniref:phage holin family protein n=1 Tax=Campylobacter sp. 19-13652 TaxID=2840180 RepID=UPI001C77FFE4|nr:phage holin family protein [Campylobacter sp. 19-13652]BCX79294.1 hypothetical protein LBC_07560 [Campylobacter sp. 19-13652]